MGRFSWLGRDRRNPGVMGWQEPCPIPSQSTCRYHASRPPQHFSSYSSSTPVSSTLTTQPIAPFLRHQLLRTPASRSLRFIHTNASTSRAACSRSEDGCPCVPQPALLRARAPRLALLLRGHLASEGAPAQRCRLRTRGSEAAWWAALSKLLPSIFTGS